MKKTHAALLFYAAAVITPLFFVDVQYNPSARADVAHPFPIIPPPFTLGTQPPTGQLGGGTSAFRLGPERTGVLTDEFLPTRVEVEYLKKNLNVGIHGASKASPAIDATGIYIGSDGGWFYALNPDGSVRWKYYATDSPLGIHSTAALDSRNVYVGTYAGDLLALDKATGRVAWIARVGETIGSSPVIIDDSILVTVETNGERDGYVVRVDRRNGRLLWRSQYLGEQSHSSPTVDLRRGLVFAGANDDMIFCFDLGSGRTVWSKKVDGKIKSTAALIDDRIFLTTWGGSMIALDAVNGEIAWTADIGAKSQSSPSYVPDLDLLIAGAEPGRITAVERKTGKIRWRRNTGWMLSRLPSALVLRNSGADGKRSSQFVAWIGCERKTLCALDAATGMPLSRYRLRGDVTGTPVYFDGSLFIALDESGLVRLSSQH